MALKVEINTVIDAACPSLLVLSNAGELPETMFVHPDLYAEIARIRKHETDNGMPLMLLGMRLAADPRLRPDAYRLAS